MADTSVMQRDQHGTVVLVKHHDNGDGTYSPVTYRATVAGVAGNVASATNGLATVTYAAGGAGVKNVIAGVAWSYSAAPTGGRLYVNDGATTILDIDITGAGPGSIAFAVPLKGSNSTALTVNLAAGGVGIVGKISVLGQWTEA